MKTPAPVALSRSFVAFVIFAAISPLLPAQQSEQKAVPVGQGSYADTPPFKDQKFAAKYNRTPFIHPSQAGRPVPTNDWWTNLVMQGPGGRLWALPALVKFDNYGVMVSYPTGWSTKRGEKGSGVETSTPLEVRLAGSPVIPATQKQRKPSEASTADALKTSVLNWGDWTVVTRQEKENNHWDVTFGHGLPFMWVECAGFQPSLRGAGLQAKDLKGAAFTGGATDALIVSVGGNDYGIYGPPGMSVTVTPDAVDIKFATSAKGWIAVGMLPDPAMATLLKSAAGAIPRDSLYTWKYDPVKGTVMTTFELKTEALRKDAGQPLQGWIPHHFRTVSNDLKPVGTPYASPRGPLRLSQGSVFHLEYAFPGILPFYPVPKVVASEKNPYDPARMSGYLASLDAERTAKPPANDTYWGGKDIQKVAQFASIADRSGDPVAKALKEKLHGYLQDWLTFGGADDKHYFAYYPTWKALVGFGTSYGSEFFTDNHFHYGYFTLSAALYATMDPTFAKDYGPMIRLVARQYANWDRNDKFLPYLRTFDPWNGHSYAGGSSSGDGNNQESTSESMNSWGGLVTLGAALNDPDMIACGAMGWAVEHEAIRSYWNNYYAWKGDKENSSWQPAYNRALISILGDSGGAYATFFSGSPQHVMGIQWLPISPSLDYLGRDPAFTRYQYDAVLKDMAAEKKPTTLSSIGADWGAVLLGFLQFGEPAAACEEMDRLFAANDPVGVKDPIGPTYFMAHAGVQIGTVAWDWHTSLPTSTVFRNGTKITAVIWNGDPKPATVQILQGAKAVKTVTVAAHSLDTVAVQ